MIDMVWGAACMTIGALVLWQWVPRFFGWRKPKNFEEWQHDIEEAACEAIRASSRAAEAQIRLADLVGKLPDDFDPVVWQGCRVADGVQRAVLVEAERAGKIRPGVVARIYGVRLSDVDSARGETVATTSNPPELPDHVWEGDELRPRRAANGQ